MPKSDVFRNSRVTSKSKLPKLRTLCSSDPEILADPVSPLFQLAYDIMRAASQQFYASPASGERNIMQYQQRQGHKPKDPRPRSRWPIKTATELHSLPGLTIATWKLKKSAHICLWHVVKKFRTSRARPKSGPCFWDGNLRNSGQKTRPRDPLLIPRSIFAFFPEFASTQILEQDHIIAELL